MSPVTTSSYQPSWFTHLKSNYHEMCQNLSCGPPCCFEEVVIEEEIQAF